MYVCSLSAVYVGVRNGLNAQELLISWGVDTNILPDGAGDVAAAWAITAVTGPARGLLTIVGTPFVAKMVPSRRRYKVQSTRQWKEMESDVQREQRLQHRILFSFILPCVPWSVIS